MTERQELYCHACNSYVQFDMDTELNGQHTIACPNCGHEHYRYVKDGVISDQRWASSGAVAQPQAQFYVTGLTFTTSSTFSTYSAGYAATDTTASAFLYGSWMNSSNAASMGGS